MSVEIKAKHATPWRAAGLVPPCPHRRDKRGGSLAVFSQSEELGRFHVDRSSPQNVAY